MKVQIKHRPQGGYNGEEWPEVGETIDLPDHVAEGMLRTGEVIKPNTAEAKEDRAQAEADAKAQEAAEKAQAKAEADAEKARVAAAEAEAKVEAAVTAPANVETATRKTTPKK